MNSIPRVAAVHDLSGLGRCSLAVVLPVLAAMGAQCCPLPTAVLSAHTAFPAQEELAFQDLTGAMGQTLRHWEALHTSFDAIYSGFLGSLRQIHILRDLICRFRRRETLVLIDPVMGDHGRVYRTYTPEMCRQMIGLTAEADLITPNLTEAALLLEESFDHIPHSRAGLEEWLYRLSLDGRRSVVVTGVSLTPDTLGAGCLDRSGGVHFTMAPREPGSFFGTGDLFAAVLLGGILRGETLCDATAGAAAFVQRSISQTLAAGTPVLDGVRFEPLLRELG